MKERRCPACKQMITKEQIDSMSKKHLDEYLLTGTCPKCYVALYGAAPNEREANMTTGYRGSNNWREANK